jgi:zinc transport system substrate-binding protein
MPFILILALLFSPTQLLATDNLKIVTSIRPLQLITDEILQGVGESESLIQSDQSPHHFQLKPSQLKTASKADLIIWVSNDFETGLGRLQNILPSKTQQLELADVLPSSSLIGENHDIDGHIWLSPENVLLIAQMVSQKLSLLDPLNDQVYLTNTMKLTHKIQKWKQQSLQKIRGIKPRYILDHQFMTYFEHSFGLQNMGSLRNNHDQGSSIKRLSELHSQLEKTPAKCLLVTTLPLSRQAEQTAKKFQLETKVINMLSEGNKHKTILDLLDPVINSLSSCQ